MGMCMCLFGARVRAVGHAVAHVSVSVDMYCVRRVARVCAPFCGGAFTLCVGGVMAVRAGLRVCVCGYDRVGGFLWDVVRGCLPFLGMPEQREALC